jgi:hypothetical protein
MCGVTSETQMGLFSIVRVVQLSPSISQLKNSRRPVPRRPDKHCLQLIQQSFCRESVNGGEILRDTLVNRYQHA